MHLRLIALAGAAILAAGCAPGDSADGVALHDSELRARDASFQEALAAKDAEQAAAHFADGAVLHIANMAPVHGGEAIRDFYGNVFRYMESSAPESEVVRASNSGDVGYSMGRVTNVFAGEQGPAEYEGKYILVWERAAGEWQIAAYSVSSNSPDTGR